MTTHITVLLGLQLFQVAILLLHDYVPLANLNDVKAVRGELSMPLLIVGTLIGSLAPVTGLCLTIAHLLSGWPPWLHLFLIAAYGLLFAGELEAWWIPYLLWPQPKRAALYGPVYGKTHAFLPERNGIRLNTLHCALHAATLATLILLFLP
jgi:hypothetical protein